MSYGGSQGKFAKHAGREKDKYMNYDEMLGDESKIKPFKDTAKWREDSDEIFGFISNFAPTIARAKEVIMIYVLDLGYTRGGISHALKRLERYYKEEIG